MSATQHISAQEVRSVEHQMRSSLSPVFGLPSGLIRRLVLHAPSSKQIVSLCVPAESVLRNSFFSVMTVEPLTAV